MTLIMTLYLSDKWVRSINTVLRRSIVQGDNTVAQISPSNSLLPDRYRRNIMFQGWQCGVEESILENVRIQRKKQYKWQGNASVLNPDFRPNPHWARLGWLKCHVMALRDGRITEVEICVLSPRWWTCKRCKWRILAETFNSMERTFLTAVRSSDAQVWRL